MTAPSYVLALLQPGPTTDGVQEYLRRIDATLAPFGGRFLIHGGPAVDLEGHLAENVVLLCFDDADGARRWYASVAYQQIAHLRSDDLNGTVTAIAGVPTDHVATDILKASAQHRQPPR